MNAEVKTIGRMSAMHESAARNGWAILEVRANQSEAVVLFNRGRGPFGAERWFGTAAYAFDGNGFFWGHYDLTFDEARIDFSDRCNRTFPA